MMCSTFQIKRRGPGLSVWRVLFWWTFMILVLRTILVVFYRYKSHGGSHVPKTGPILFVANHQSNFDPSIVGILVGDRPFKGIAKVALFESKLLGAFMHGFGVISIKPGESDVTAIRDAIKELSAGRCIMMFPEGTRTKDGAIGKFQRGFWLLMKRSNAIVLPIGLEGAYECYPFGSKPKLRGWIEVAAGEPIEACDLLDMGEEEGTEFVRSRVEELRLQCRVSIDKRSNKNRCCT